MVPDRCPQRAKDRNAERPRHGLEPKGKGCPALRGVGQGRVSQPKGENPEPLTLRWVHTDHRVLGPGDKDSCSCHGGEGILQVFTLPSCPPWLLIRWFRPCSLKGWRSGPQGGGHLGGWRVSRGICPRSLGRLDVGREKGCGVGTGSQVRRAELCGLCVHTRGSCIRTGWWASRGKGAEGLKNSGPGVKLLGALWGQGLSLIDHCDPRSPGLGHLRDTSLQGMVDGHFRRGGLSFLRCSLTETLSLGPQPLGAGWRLA